LIEKAVFLKNNIEKLPSIESVEFANGSMSKA
jgi:hypothetical protein